MNNLYHNTSKNATTLSPQQRIYARNLHKTSKQYNIPPYFVSKISLYMAQGKRRFDIAKLLAEKIAAIKKHRSHSKEYYQKLFDYIKYCTPEEWKALTTTILDNREVDH